MGYREPAMLPTLRTFRQSSVTASQSQLLKCVTDGENTNLTPLEKELLKWHYRLGHLGLDHVQWLARHGHLGPSAHRIGKTTITQRLLCSACQYGKMTRQPTKASTKTVKRDKEFSLQRNILQPGQLCATDQYVCTLKGRVKGSRGRTPKDQMYGGGTVFVDVASRKIAVKHQVSLERRRLLCPNKHMRENV